MTVSKSILLVSLLTITTGVFAEDFIFANGVKVTVGDSFSTLKKNWPDVKVNSIYDIGTANYSWASHKIKSTPRLEEKFLSLLKAKTPEQRKQISYENFKKEYCD